MAPSMKGEDVRTQAHQNKALNSLLTFLDKATSRPLQGKGEGRWKRVEGKAEKTQAREKPSSALFHKRVRKRFGQLRRIQSQINPFRKAIVHASVNTEVDNADDNVAYSLQPRSKSGEKSESDSESIPSKIENASGNGNGEAGTPWSGVTAFESAVERIREAGKAVEPLAFIREFNDQLKGGVPNRRRLDIVQEFFQYTEDEGRVFFQDLDRDKDGCVTLEDMKVEMARRNLPMRYANEFIRRAKRHSKWPFGNKISWEDFRSLMQEREAAMLKAFNSLEVSQFGSLKKHQIMTLLQKLHYNASDENTNSMLKYLDADASGYISYGKFRNFLILVPKETFLDQDIGSLWFESATMVPLMYSTKNASKKMVILSTLASAAISGTSTLALHPIDTLKTRLQASSGQSAIAVLKSVRKLGSNALYRGVIPATAGAASSQGFRVGVFEAVRIGMKVVLPQIPDLQVQTIASGMGAVIGTAVRIPCEVLKQRLQAGQHPEVITAMKTVIRADGFRGFFRGSAATLSREIPFYVLGMVAYEQLKKAATTYSKEKRGKNLESWETIAVGALSGAIAAALTTPADVIKTRLMTSAVGQEMMPIREIFVKILNEEGLGALFKGALPRAMWIAPLGALNFAGYELAKNAMAPSE